MSHEASDTLGTLAEIVREGGPWPTADVLGNLCAEVQKLEERNDRQAEALKGQLEHSVKLECELAALRKLADAVKAGNAGPVEYARWAGATQTAVVILPELAEVTERLKSIAAALDAPEEGDSDSCASVCECEEKFWDPDCLADAEDEEGYIHHQNGGWAVHDPDDDLPFGHGDEGFLFLAPGMECPRCKRPLPPNPQPAFDEEADPDEED